MKQFFIKVNLFMYNLKQSKTKKIICSFVLVLGVLLSAFSGYHFNISPVTKVYADATYNTDQIAESIFEENSSEANYYSFYTSSTSTSSSISGWEKTNTNNDIEDSVKACIVDLSGDKSTWDDEDNTYKTTKPNFLQPNHTNNKSYYKALMINSHNGANSYGYKSNSITLESDSYYEISVELYTHKVSNEDGIETDPRASIYIDGLLDSDEDDEDLLRKVKFEEIFTNTKNTLETYTFYITTGESKSINIELWLGSKNSKASGAVFFHEVKVIRCSEAYFDRNYSDLPTEGADAQNYNFINLSKQKDASFIENSSFESIPFSGWTVLAGNPSVEAINYTNSDANIVAPGSNCAKDNDHALLMYNSESSSQGVESSKFTVNQQSYYRISFWAKTNCNTGNGATVYLVDKTEDSTTDSASLTLSTSYTEDSNKFRNDWSNYNFYIYGPANGTKELAIQIWLGTEDSETEGYVFVDDFTIEQISYSDYNSNKSNTGCTNLDLNQENSNLTITNGQFNVTQNADNATSYPLTPASWTRSGDTNSDTYSGVVNTNVDIWNNNVDNFYNKNGVKPANPGALPYAYEGNDQNNVLMIGSTAETNSQSYAVSELSLSASSYYRLKFYVFDDYTRNKGNDEDYGASVKLATSNQVIFDYKNLWFGDGHWHEVELYIHTGISDLTATLSLNFEGVNGYVFFDDVMIFTSNEDAYSKASKSSQIDLAVDNFDNRIINSNIAIQTPTNWTSKQENTTVSTVDSGIMPATSDAIKDLDRPKSGNENVLYISSSSDVYYSFVSTQTYTFSSGTYYKISVNILTRNNIISEDVDDDVVYGASFCLSASDEVIFKGITTGENWETYTIYFCPDAELTSAISLSLGAKDEYTSGDVLFDNLVIETIDEDAYFDGIGSTEDKYYKAFINYVPETDDEEDEESVWENDFNWLILPSLITALAIVIAVVGYYVRKISFNRKPKIKTKYDRRKTLDKDIDRREQIALRKQIIAELNEELLAIDKEIEEYKVLASQKFEVIKERIIAEQDRIKKAKLEIEIKKKEAKAEREKQLKENPELVSNTKAEKDYANFVARLDKQELALQKQLNAQNVKLATAEMPDNIKLDSFLERKEYIKNEIAKIEAEIEEIAKEETEMWAEYKVAKAEAKKQKAEEKNKKTVKKSTSKNTDKVAKTKSSNKEEVEESAPKTDTNATDSPATETTEAETEVKEDKTEE